jgi:hypothetical protein
VITGFRDRSAFHTLSVCRRNIYRRQVCRAMKNISNLALVALVRVFTFMCLQVYVLGDVAPCRVVTNCRGVEGSWWLYWTIITSIYIRGSNPGRGKTLSCITFRPAVGLTEPPAHLVPGLILGGKAAGE